MKAPTQTPGVQRRATSTTPSARFILETTPLASSATRCMYFRTTFDFQPPMARNCCSVAPSLARSVAPSWRHP